MRSTAKIHHATREAFVHRHVGFAGEGVLGMETVAVAADAAFVAKGRCHGLSEGDAAILDGVVRIHRQIAAAMQIQIHGRMLGEQREHVIKKWKAGFDL